MLATSSGSTSAVSSQASTMPDTSPAGVFIRPIASTLASFQRRAPRAVSASAHSAARTPGTLLAAIDTPVPVQQQSTPPLTARWATSRATWWARSILSLAWPYRPASLGAPASVPAGQPGRPRGRFSAYACLASGDRSADYHDVLAAQCDRLAGWLGVQVPGTRTKRFVDHGWA